MSALGDLFRNNLSLEKGSPLGGLVESYGGVPTAAAVHYGGKAVRNASEALGTASTLTGVMSGAVDPTSPQALKAISNVALGYGGGSYVGAPARPGPGMFGGKLAANADLKALERAQDIYKPELNNSFQSMRETGWLPGADDKWRFEMSDHNAKLTPKATSDLKLFGVHEGDLGDILSHPELFQNYPELAKLKTRVDVNQTVRPGGSYSPERGTISSRSNSFEGPDNPVSTLLHEAQHGVQHIEGFAPGGSHELFNNPEQAKHASNVLNFRREVEARMRADPTLIGDWDRAAKEVEREYWRLGMPREFMSPVVLAHAKPSASNLANPQLERWVNVYGLNKQTTPYTPEVGYKRLAGEVESRNVETRRFFTPEERRQAGRLPSQTEDVLRRDQTIDTPRPIPFFYPR